MSTSTINSEEQVVVFRLDGESYGIDIFRIHEIIRMREITPVPGTDEHIRGLVNLRGKTIPVVDLKSRFGQLASDHTDTTRIIVVESAQGNVGIIVDEVREVRTLAGEDVENAPALATTDATDFVRGVAKDSDTLVTLLDLDRLLAA